MKTITRSGRYYRVCDPTWLDCCDPTYSARYGGRWNPPESFATLYLNADVDTARANAIRRYEGEAFTLFDLNPTTRPHLQLVTVKTSTVLDAVTRGGIEDLGLPATYRENVSHTICQAIGVEAHKARLDGVACLSAAHRDGEELALYRADRAVKGERQVFDAWFYPKT